MIRQQGVGKVWFTLLVGLAAMVWAVSVPQADAQTASTGVASGEAAAVLNATREALGGEKRIGSVKTVVVSGRSQQLQGDNLIPIEYEVSMSLPDMYVRSEEVPVKGTGPSRRGFTGDQLIQAGDDSGGGGARRGGPPPAPAGDKPQARGGMPPGASAGAPPSPVEPVKQDFARMTLGMFAAAYSSYPLTFGYLGQAEAPEGKADVIDVKGSGGFAARLFIDSKTHLPLMLSWTTPANLVPVVAGTKPPANLAPGSTTFETPAPPSSSATADERKQFEDAAIAAQKKAMAAARPTEHRLYYADYRDVDGLKLPFRFRRAIGATTVDETTVDRYRINARIDPRRFEVRP